MPFAKTLVATAIGKGLQLSKVEKDHEQIEATMEEEPQPLVSLHRAARDPCATESGLCREQPHEELI